MCSLKTATLSLQRTLLCEQEVIHPTRTRPTHVHTHGVTHKRGMSRGSHADDICVSKNIVPSLPSTLQRTLPGVCVHVCLCLPSTQQVVPFLRSAQLATIPPGGDHYRNRHLCVTISPPHHHSGKNAHPNLLPLLLLTCRCCTPLGSIRCNKSLAHRITLQSRHTTDTLYTDVSSVCVAYTYTHATQSDLNPPCKTSPTCHFHTPTHTDTHTLYNLPPSCHD